MSIDSPGQLALPAESSQKQSPDFADVRNFLNHTSIGGGLSEGELDDIINNPAKAADEAVASFLKENFADMRRLSSSGTNEIVSEDLNVYAELLKQAESNAGQGMPADYGLYDMHSRLENKAEFWLPAIGGMFGFSAGAVASPLFSVLGALATMKIGPLAHKIGWLGGGAASVVTGTYIGASIGGDIDRGLNSASHQQYFNDEAGPAMKRLLQKEYPTDKG
jgi:hypothetical protein